MLSEDSVLPRFPVLVRDAMHTAPEDLVCATVARVLYWHLTRGTDVVAVAYTPYVAEMQTAVGALLAAPLVKVAAAARNLIIRTDVRIIESETADGSRLAVGALRPDRSDMVAFAILEERDGVIAVQRHGIGVHADGSVTQVVLSSDGRASNLRVAPAEAQVAHFLGAVCPVVVGMAASGGGHRLAINENVKPGNA